MPSTTVYATAAELFGRINFSAVPTATQTAKAEGLLAAVSRTIDGWCNAQDGFIAPAVGTEKVFAGSGRNTQRIRPCVAISLVEVKESRDTDYVAWAADDWIAFGGSPSFPTFEPPYEYIQVDPAGSQAWFLPGRVNSWDHRSVNVPTVRVTARWGQFAAITDVPQVREATIFQAAIWYKRLESAGGDTVASADFGVLRFRKSLDPAVVAMLSEARHRRPSIA
jgi:hypothetical protein